MVPLLIQNDHGFDLEEHGIDGKLGHGDQRLRRQCFAEHVLDVAGQHLELGHIVIDHEDRQLSLERIVATAMELLDAEGVDGLKMRRLADRLGAGAMSLYWHVDNKEAVFDLALDSVLEYRAPPGIVASEDWREDIVHMLEDWRASMLRHPWSASLLPRRALGPNILSRLELLQDLVRSRCH